MTEGTASTERFHREPIERTPAAGEASIFSSSIWNDNSTKDILRAITLNERSSTGLSITTGDTFIIEPPPGFLASIPAVRIVPKASDTSPPITAIGDKPRTIGAEATTPAPASDRRDVDKITSELRPPSVSGGEPIFRPRETLTTTVPEGIRRESTGASGEVRSMLVDRKGDFVDLTLRTAAGERKLVPGDWAALKPGGSVNLGGDWTATRGDFGGRLSGDTIRLGHPDGTSYYISPEGRLLHAQGPNETIRMSMGPLGDMGTRYTTADRRHMGENSIDVDDLGLVRGLAFRGADGVRRSLPLALLDEVPADGLVHRPVGDWQVSRTGSGADSVLSIVAPDGRTTYKLDAMGRIISGVSALDRADRTAVVSRDLLAGASRHDSVMADGSVASAVVSPDGLLARITLRGRTTTTSTSITRTEWNQALLTSGGNIGNGWSVALIDSKYTGNQTLPHGSVMISHTDGTSYFVGPTGKFISAHASWASRRRR